MGNLSHVLRRSDTSIAVSRLPHCVTGGVESCGSLLRRNFYIGGMRVCTAVALAVVVMSPGLSKKKRD
jgi:hypothetical protein